MAIRMHSETHLENDIVNEYTISIYLSTRQKGGWNVKAWCLVNVSLATLVQQPGGSSLHV